LSSFNLQIKTLRGDSYIKLELVAIFLKCQAKTFAVTKDEVPAMDCPLARLAGRDSIWEFHT